jgi:hypothetical protein
MRKSLLQGVGRKWSNMADFNKRRRWRGPALGGRLQRAARFCFSSLCLQPELLMHLLIAPLRTLIGVTI